VEKDVLRRRRVVAGGSDEPKALADREPLDFSLDFRVGHGVGVLCFDYLPTNKRLLLGKRCVLVTILTSLF
jgi:hypothetical protein